jgi:hypothetical protein
MKVDKASRRVAELRRKLKRLQAELHAVSDELGRAERRYELAIPGTNVEVKGGNR